MVKTNVHSIDIHCTQVKYKFSYIKWTNGTKYRVHTIMSTHHINYTDNQSAACTLLSFDQENNYNNAEEEVRQ